MKTYATAIISLVYAASAYLGHYIDAEAAIQIAQVAIVGAFLRHGIAKV